MGIFSFLSGGQPQPVVLPQYTGVQIQTSSNALPIPIVYGTNVLAPNFIFAGAFLAEPVYGTGSHPTITGYNYTQNLIFGLCEGPIARIGLCFQDSDIYTLSDPNFGGVLYNGAVPPTAPTGPSFVTAAKKMGYAGTAYVGAYEFDLGTSASTGSINIEVHGILDATAGTNGFDADPALMFQDLWTNPTYGLGLPASALDLTTLLSPASGADRSYQGYCKATELGLSAALVNAEKANSILTRWLQLTNAGPVWSGGKLKVIPYGDTAITTAPKAGSLTQPIPAIDGDTTDGPQAPYIRVNFGFISDNGVINVATGAPFTKVAGPNNLQSGQYYLSTRLAGRYVFSSNDVNVAVTISFTYASLAAFTPNLVPLYDLTDDDFVDTGDGPVSVSRTDPSQLANVVRLEIADRNNFYSSTTIEARDQNAVELYGYRLGSTITAHEITNAQDAQVVGQLVLQRGLGVRSTYAFTLSWEFVLLEPMDIVTLTDQNLGLAKTPVRLVQIEEDDQGFLACTAEELNAGIGTAVVYGTGGGAAAGGLGTTTVPAPVTPAILEAPAQIAGNQIEIIFGANAILAGAPDPNYGGCNVFVSYDNGATFAQIAGFMGQSAMGVLTAALPTGSGVNPDTADTLTVSLAQSGASLDPSSQAMAQGDQSLVLVDNELISYGAASGTPGGVYALTYLERGQDGTAVAAHAAGAPFFCLQGLMASAVLPSSTKGATVIFKFQGYNVFGKGVQALASCTPYPMTITGRGLTS